METYNATEARANLYGLIAKAVNSSEPIQITSKQGNAVLIGEADWRAIQETMYLSGIPGFVEGVKKAAASSDFVPMDEVDWD